MRAGRGVFVKKAPQSGDFAEFFVGKWGGGLEFEAGLDAGGAGVADVAVGRGEDELEVGGDVEVVVYLHVVHDFQNFFVIVNGGAGIGIRAFVDAEAYAEVVIRAGGAKVCGGADGEFAPAALVVAFCPAEAGVYAEVVCDLVINAAEEAEGVVAVVAAIGAGGVLLAEEGADAGGGIPICKDVAVFTYEGIAVSAFGGKGVVTPRGAHAGDGGAQVVAFIDFCLQDGGQVVIGEGEDAGAFEVIVHKAGVAYAVVVVVQFNHAGGKAGTFAGEEVFDGYFEEGDIVGAHHIGMEAGTHADAVCEVGFCVGGIVVQSPGAGQIRAEPGAAIEGVLDEALLEDGVKDGDLAVGAVAGGGVIDGPVAIIEVHEPLGAVEVVRLFLEFRGVISRGEHMGVVDKGAGDYVFPSRGGGEQGSGAKGEGKEEFFNSRGKHAAAS